ncbi:MAG: hypothetical protein AAGG01_11190, partial [Planctomycetota bacterium]
LGTSGLVWEGFRDIRFAFNGEFFIRGRTQEGSAIARTPFGTPILKTGDLLQLAPGPIRRIERFEVSPNGSSWAARVVLDDQVQFRQALVANGAPLVNGGGFMIERFPVPPDYDLPGAVWASFGAFSIADDFRVTFQAVVTHPDGTPETVTVRGNRLAARGGVLTQLRDTEASTLSLYTTDTDVLVEDLPIVGANARVDIDGDGVADSGYGLGSDASGSANWSAQFTSSGVIGRCLIDRPGPQGDVAAVVRLVSGAQGGEYCEGVLNSTFERSTLTAVGQTSRLANDLSLVCVDLPLQTIGYAIASRTQGFVAGPQGSLGNLCLGGEIGRLIPEMFSTGDVGVVSIPVDLQRIPRPIGTVSAMAGETWNFQVWHRDHVSGFPTSNFSGAVAVELTD